MAYPYQYLRCRCSHMQQAALYGGSEDLPEVPHVVRDGGGLLELS
jgi:hypothetical protein